MQKPFEKGFADPMLLGDRQLARFRLLLFVADNALETLHMMFVQSHIGASEWNKVKPTALRIFATPGGRTWLALFKDENDPALAKALSELAESKPISGMPSRSDWQTALGNKTQSRPRTCLFREGAEAAGAALVKTPTSVRSTTSRPCAMAPAST